MTFTAGGTTDPGPRPSNEDALLLEPDIGLFVVADGMGGHSAGEVAARLAVDTLAEFVRSTHSRKDVTWPFPFDPSRSLLVNRLSAGVRLANRAVYERSTRDPECAGMGTTIVAALVVGDRVAIGHVGDSRAYRLRRGTLMQKTQDHTWVNAVLGAGSQMAIDHPFRHVLTSGVGLATDVSVAIDEEEIQPGDRWLLCSDGVHGALAPERLMDVVGGGSSQEAAAHTIRAALEAGCTDNVTAVVISLR